MSRIWAAIIFGLFGLLPLSARAANSACPPDVLRAYVPPEDRDLWLKFQGARKNESEVREQLATVELEIKMTSSESGAHELKLRKAEIEELLKTAEARTRERSAQRGAQLEEVGKDLERRTFEYIQGKDGESSFDLIRLAQRVLDLQGVVFEQTLIDGKHLALNISGADVRYSAMWTQNVRKRSDQPMRIIYAPSYLKESNSLARVASDSSVLYIDAQTLVRGRLSPDGLHEFGHLLTLKKEALRGPDMRRAQLQDSEGFVLRDELGRYTEGGVARFIDLRARLTQLKQSKAPTKASDLRDFQVAWENYLASLQFGRRFALRSAVLLRELKSLPHWEAILEPNPDTPGQLRLAVVLSDGRVQRFATSARTLENAVRLVSQNLEQEAAFDDATAAAFQEVWRQQAVTPATLGVRDFEVRIERAVPALRKLWKLSRAKSPKL